MKKLSSFLLLLGLLTTSFAQDNVGIDQNDPKAKAILDGIKDKYEAYKSLDVDFTLTIEFPEEDAEVQKGHISQEGDKYKLDLASQSIISDGQSMWFHLKNRNEVQINDIEEGMEDEDMLSPQSLLRIYEKDNFLFALVGEAIEGGKTVQKIEFKPLDTESEYFKMRLTVDKKTQQINRIKTFSKDGSRYTLDIDNFTPNKVFADGHFGFNKSNYPGIHIEDLRMD